MGLAQRKYSLFLDTILNKVDAKGRVSIPADYRSLLEQSETQLVAFPSLPGKPVCIECCTYDMMEKMTGAIDYAFSSFGDERQDDSAFILSEAKEFPYDSTGRIMLSEKLMKHAGITDKALFVGKGRTFEIWNPESYRIESQRRAERLANNGREGANHG